MGAGRRRPALLRSPTWRWLPPLLLAAYALVDFVSQALLPAAARAAAAGWVPLPAGVLDFLQSTVGWDAEAQGAALALRLLRPALLLAALAAFRSLFVLGSTHRQLQQEMLSPGGQAALRSRAELGWRALGKRAVILHGSKAAWLLAAGAAVAQPGVVGWLLSGELLQLAHIPFPLSLTRLSSSAAAAVHAAVCQAAVPMLAHWVV